MLKPVSWVVQVTPPSVVFLIKLFPTNHPVWLSIKYMSLFKSEDGTPVKPGTGAHEKVLPPDANAMFIASGSVIVKVLVIEQLLASVMVHV